MKPSAGMGKAMQKINRAVARTFRTGGGHDSGRSAAGSSILGSEAWHTVEQSKWSSSTAAVTVRPPRLPASVDFGAAFTSLWVLE